MLHTRDFAILVHYLVAHYGHIRQIKHEVFPNSKNSISAVFRYALVRGNALFNVGSECLTFQESVKIKGNKLQGKLALAVCSTHLI